MGALKWRGTNVMDHMTRPLFRDVELLLAFQQLNLHKSRSKTMVQT